VRALLFVLFVPLLAGASFAQDTASPPEDKSPGNVVGTHPAIKPTDESKTLPPIRRLPKLIWHDQKGIWSSPFRMSKSDAKWWIILGGTTAGLIASDKWLARQLPNTHDQLSVSNWTSKVGSIYVLLPVSAGLYFLGSEEKNDQLRETSLLSFEALGDALIVDTLLKTATQRERPTEGTGSGRFWQGSGRFWNAGSSFPSGHAIETWALASVIAHEIPHPRWVPVLCYGLAMAVNGSRFAARKHFASDVVAGSAMGWFIGDFVYRHRHQPAFDKRSSTMQKILAHVEVGASF
jgi:membrane-associated phospholipid phosphatase